MQMKLKKAKYKGFEIEINEDGTYILVDGSPRKPYKIMPRRTKRGFMQVWLGRRKKAYVHILVAAAWLKDFDPRMIVTHKDTNTLNTLQVWEKE